MKREIIAESAGMEDEMLFADGFDDALIGHVTIFNKTVALYDRAKCIRILRRQGMTWEEAEEFFEFNVQGSYVGENTPGYAVLVKR